MSTFQPKKNTLLLRICISILLLGNLFKIMHWPNAYDLLTFSISGILIVYPIRFYFKQDKETMDYIKVITIVLWCLNFLLGFNQVFGFSILIILFGWWLLTESANYFNSNQLVLSNIAQKVYYGFIAISIGSIAFGTLFKIQHWPYANVLFTLGVFLASILVIVDYFVRRKTEYV
tara:strand:+ start:6277 stop:6801 length:525 start_codon:yes stop_codon:yes gene_type:complete